MLVGSIVWITGIILPCIILINKNRQRKANNNKKNISLNKLAVIAERLIALAALLAVGISGTIFAAVHGHPFYQILVGLWVAFTSASHMAFVFVARLISNK